MQRTYTGIASWAASPSFERMTAKRVTPGWWWLPAFIAAAFVLYWPVLELTPFSDDHSALWNSGVLGIPWRNGIFRPLSDLTFRVGYWFWGTAAEGHRAFNVVVHAANAYLLIVLCEQHSTERNRKAGLVAATLFLVYPFHQESVVWLVGRESSLGTLFILLGMVIGGTAWTIRLRIILLTVALVLGLLCYEGAALLVPLALLSSALPLNQPWRELRTKLYLPALVMLGFLVLRSLQVDADTYIIGSLQRQPVQVIENIPKVIARLFLPPEADPTTQLLRGAVLLIGLTISGYWITRSAALHTRRRDLIPWTVLTIVACAVGFVAGVSTITSESDRYLYLPSAFLCVLLGTILSCIASRTIRWSVTLLMAITSIVLLKQNHANWTEASRITERCVRAFPKGNVPGRVWVSGLPSEHRGAFIFRNGFPEAVALTGGHADQVIVVPPTVMLETALGSGLVHRGNVYHFAPRDVVLIWNNDTYTVHSD